MPITVNSNPQQRLPTSTCPRTTMLCKRVSIGCRVEVKLYTPMMMLEGLAVSMKLESAVVRLKGAEKNIQNGISFLEVQDGQDVWRMPVRL